MPMRMLQNGVPFVFLLMLDVPPTCWVLFSIIALLPIAAATRQELL
jgi:hypothetical protein